MKLFIYYLIFSLLIVFNQNVKAEDNEVPNLVGTWIGKNDTLSEQRGYRSWEKKLRLLNKKIAGLKELSFTLTAPKTFSVLYIPIIKLLHG